MAKKKKPQRAPNLSPLSLLRPRLDGLLNNPGWATGDAAAIQADLSAVVKGIEATAYLPILLKTVNDADPAAQQKLTPLLPAWLEQVGTVDALSALVEQGNLQPQELALAGTLLQAVGVAVSPVSAEAGHAFHSAYYGADGLGSQAFLIFLWAANRQQSRVRGLSFLIDFNPPWDGAVKDVMTLPQRSPREMVEQFVDRWRHQEVAMDIEQLDGAAAKQRLIEALTCNRTHAIRLPRDLVLIRDLVTKHILALPDSPETSPFTLADFDELARGGQSAESIMHMEQTIGHRVRLDDGTEIIVKED
ncbi:MAG: hypothetical protein DYG89_08665 [Caldilinea sp. CFX5]|nr:hypothetical protein [Caldilinea sp. CFX5]